MNTGQTGRFAEQPKEIDVYHDKVDEEKNNERDGGRQYSLIPRLVPVEAFVPFAGLPAGFNEKMKNVTHSQIFLYNKKGNPLTKKIPFFQL